MPGQTFSAQELARELGRAESWLYDCWRQLVIDQRMPPPLMGGARPMVWSRAQIYAWLDIRLTRPQQAYAAAFRAAQDAAAGAGSDEALAIAESRKRLDALLPAPSDADRIGGAELRSDRHPARGYVEARKA